MNLQTVASAIGRKYGGGVPVYLRAPEDKQYKDGCFTQTQTKSYVEVDPALWERDPWQFISVLLHECGHAVTAHHPMTGKRWELAAREYEREIVNRVYQQTSGNATKALFYLAEMEPQALDNPDKEPVKRAAPAEFSPEVRRWMAGIEQQRAEWESRYKSGGRVQPPYKTYDNLKIIL